MAIQITSERHHQIIEATQSLITSKGMEFVTIDAIAEKVGLTEGAIYKNFRSKRAILTLLIDSIEQNLMETLVNSKQVGDSSLDHLGRILVAHLNDVFAVIGLRPSRCLDRYRPRPCLQPTMCHRSKTA